MSTLDSQPVTIGDKQYLVAPLRLNNPENLEFLAIAWEAVEIDLSTDDKPFGITMAKHVRLFVPCLRRSLAENHTEAEVEQALAAIPSTSLGPDSPFMLCCYVMIGRRLAADK